MSNKVYEYKDAKIGMLENGLPMVADSILKMLFQKNLVEWRKSSVN